MILAVAKMREYIFGQTELWRRAWWGNIIDTGIYNIPLLGYDFKF